MTARSASGSSTSRWGSPVAISCGRCWKEWPTTRAGCWCMWSGSSSAAWRRLRPWAAAPARSCGARSTPMCFTGWCCLGGGVPRRRRPHRVPEPGVRDHLAGQPAPRRPVAERHQVRGGDRGHDRGHARRRRRADRRAHAADRRQRHLWRHREHPAGDARLPGLGQGGPAHHPAGGGSPYHRPRRLRQGRPVLPHQACPRARDGRLPGRCGGDAAGHHPQHRGAGRLGADLPARGHRSHRGSRRHRAATGIGMHTDACLGGFVLPWARRLGYDVPGFDFHVPGVTSMSADTHKFGYAAKGTSVVLYRGAHLRWFQYFTATDWPGGLYFSPTLAGSRPGALSAACWAAMVATGEDGYLEATRRILETGAAIRRGVQAIPHLRVLGDPLWVIAFASDTVDIYRVLEHMTRRGWSLNGLHRPAAVHLCVTLRHTQPGMAERFLGDLHASVEEVEAQPAGEEGLAPVYGLAATIPFRGMVRDLLKKYIDLLYRP